MVRRVARACGYFGAVVGAIVGCGPDASVRATLEDVCGEPSPHRVLALDEGEQLIARGGAVTRIGDRTYYVTGPVVGPEDLDQEGFGLLPTPTTTTVYSTGPCGESPRIIARDVFGVFEHERWPGAVLGCAGNESASDMVRLDPAGIEPPRVVFPGPACGGGRETSHGIVGPLGGDESASTLVLLSWPDDPATGPVEPIVVLDGIEGDGSWTTSGSAQSELEELFALDPQGRVVSVVLPNGAPIVEQTGVRAFDVSPDGRFLAWLDAVETGDGSGLPTGVVTLRDRRNGESLEIGDGYFASYPPLGREFLKIALRDSPTLRLVDLSSLEIFDLPHDGIMLGPLDDGRWMKSPEPSGPFSLVSLSTGEETLVTERRGSAAFGPVEMILLEGAIGWFGSPEEGKLWRIPYDGSGEQLLARRATWNTVELADHRWVTALDVADDWIGDLVLVDHTLEEQLIDEQVFANWPASHLGAFFDDRVVLYGVTDGERSGVWLSRIAAAE